MLSRFCRVSPGDTGGSKELGSQPSREPDPAPPLWPRLTGRPAARELDKVISGRRSEPAPRVTLPPATTAAQPTPFPLENLSPASETPVVTPPGCRPSAARRTVSGGRRRCQPLHSPTLISEEQALWLLALALLGGSLQVRNTPAPTPAPSFLAAPPHLLHPRTIPTTLTHLAHHQAACQPGRRVWRPARCQGADSARYSRGSDVVTGQACLSRPMGPLTPAQPCKPRSQQLLPVPALWSRVKWGPQKDSPTS